MITDINQLDLTKAYTFQDYLSWKLQAGGVPQRVELLRGYIAKMSAPSSIHQIISWNLSDEIASFLRKKKCRAFYAPFDVYLPSLLGNGETVVQPDICVICDTTKIKRKGCFGAPDLIIEILSPGNSRKEMRDKYAIYEQAGVKEYWVVFPSEQAIQIYRLHDETYKALPMAVSGDVLQSCVLEGFDLLVDTIFENNLDFEEE